MSRGRAVTVAVLVAGGGLFAATRLAGVLPATVAVLGAVVVLADIGGRRAPVVAGAAAVLSAAWTAASIAAGRRLGTDLASGLLTLTETLAILVAVAFVVARAAPRPAAAAVALSVVAVSTTVLRSGAADASATTALGGAVWGLLVLGATAAGLYLRGVATRQAAAIGAARREHRLQLAADLHDYVAHDVSEMLALAQAGRVVSADPRAAELFDAIERAAQHSMLSLDRAVAALGDAAADLDDLLSRFDRTTAARIAETLFLAPGTVKNHIAAIQRKVGAANRVGVAVWAYESGLVPR